MRLSAREMRMFVALILAEKRCDDANPEVGIGPTLEQLARRAADRIETTDGGHIPDYDIISAVRLADIQLRRVGCVSRRSERSESQRRRARRTAK